MDSNYNYEEELMIKIAWYYYIENLTQQEIAKILGINRIKILRLLDKAKENGLITFQIRNSNAKRFHMENTFKELFHLNDILIIPSVPSSDSLNDSLAQAASMYINQRIKENSYINMGYGDTPSRILNYLAQRSESPINVISLTGGVNYYLPNTESNVFNARLHLIPCPLILSSSFIMEELKKETAIQRISKMALISDFTVVSYHLYQIVTLKYISNALMKRIKSNYRKIVGFNSGLIALGVAGVLPPTTTALLHNGSTILISVNSMKNLLE